MPETVTWHEARHYGKIVPVEVVKETALSIVIVNPGAANTRRVFKSTPYSRFFATRAEAKTYLVERADAAVVVAIAAVTTKEAFLVEMQAL